jgi:hypothetical protein
MAAPTVQDVVKAAITELSQVPGLATQIYATPRLQQFVQNALLLEVQEMWWPMLMLYQQVAVDAATGLLSADLVGPISSIDEYGNVAGVYQEGRHDKIPELPQSINPFALTGAGRIRYISADTTIEHRPFRVWPTGATGTVTVWAQQVPVMPMSLTDKVYLDPLLLLFDACWMYSVDDGTVPAQVNKYQVLAANRRKKMIAQYSQHPLPLDTRHHWEDMVATDGGWDGGFFVLDEDPLA